jgi:DeoR family transcriptional regulator of aga operon/DeoR family fructose operon transcriptional repressor
LSLDAATHIDSVFVRERQDRIARIVEERGRARVTDLAASFGVSVVTIRKDLLVLEDERRLVRTHGGAIAATRDRPELAFDIRDRLQSDEKSRIGAIGASLVSDGESVSLDASTTALYLARHLKARSWQQLTVVTNGILIASELAGQPGIVVLMPGGRVRWEALSLIGPLGSSVYKKINIQKAFVGAAGFTIESGLSDAMEEEAQIKRSMVAAASEVVAIIDHTKWGRASSATFCRTNRIRTVLTDLEAPPEIVGAVRGLGIDVRLIGPNQISSPAEAVAGPGDRYGRVTL